MGFGGQEKNLHASSLSREEVMDQVEPEDLITFGFIPEFIGRLPVSSVLHQLTEDQLVTILTEPKNALTKQFAKLLALEDVSLEFTPDALRELAVLASKKGTGARALRSLLEKIMLDVMYDVPTSGDIESVKITRQVVLGEATPLITRKAVRAAA
jgi:ATP-dependent Clp protease ATP-binding subunit ClpX